jgi:hypothetical protein
MFVIFKTDLLPGNCLPKKLITMLFDTSFTQFCEKLVINAKFQFYVKFPKSMATQSEQFRDHGNEIRVEVRQ